MPLRSHAGLASPTTPVAVHPQPALGRDHQLTREAERRSAASARPSSRSDAADTRRPARCRNKLMPSDRARLDRHHRRLLVDRAPVPAELPGAVRERGHRQAGGSQCHCLHVVLLPVGVPSAAGKLHARQGEPASHRRVNPQLAAATPRAALRAAMIAPPTVIAMNDRAKLVWKKRCRSQARTSSSLATYRDGGADRRAPVANVTRPGDFAVKAPAGRGRGPARRPRAAGARRACRRRGACGS